MNQADMPLANQQPWYFNIVRRDISPLLPVHARNVLEIGCGAGATLEWLQSSGRANTTTGIEPSGPAAALARTRIDRLLEGPVEQHLDGLEPEAYDLLLCLDVLEHLVDPWAVLKRLRECLRPGGSVIVSLPNVRHHGVVLPLLFGGQWKYCDAGILDRTHLRFFGQRSARELVTQAGLKLTAEASTGHRPGDGDFWKNVLTMGLFSNLFTWQFLLRGTRA